MDCIYLTNHQIAALYKLTHTTRGKATRMVGVQLETDDAAASDVRCVSIATDLGMDFVTIDPNGQHGGWER